MWLGVAHDRNSQRWPPPSRARNKLTSLPAAPPSRSSRPPQVSVVRAPELSLLAERWRAMERCCDASFFQSWTWVGCLAQERYRDAVLLCVQQDGQDRALALFGQRRSRLAPNTLWLNETGDARFDAMFVEHNGVLCARGHEALREASLVALLGGEGCVAGTAMPVPRFYRRGLRLVLSGVNSEMCEIAARIARSHRTVLRVLRTEPAPYVDFSLLDAGPDGFVDHLSPGTRYQLRRSTRRYAELGPVAIRRAQSVEEAHAMLDELAVLHQATWTARGQPGAFANPRFRQFHLALIARGMPRDEIDLLRITAGDRLIGCLYNFRYNGRVMTYQSGFDYRTTHAHQKPGLTTHHLAIEMYRASGQHSYDFLAGEDRYKTSLANAAHTMHWIDLVPRWSLRGMLIRLRTALLNTDRIA